MINRARVMLFYRIRGYRQVRGRHDIDKKDERGHPFKRT